MRRDPTTAYLASFIPLGLASNSIGPGLTALRQQVGVDVGTISQLFIASAIGYFTGSMLSGRGYDRRLGHRLYAAGLAGSGTALFVAGFVAAFPALMAAFFLVGMSGGAIDVGGNTLMVWQRQGKRRSVHERAPPVLRDRRAHRAAVGEPLGRVGRRRPHRLHRHRRPVVRRCGVGLALRRAAAVGARCQRCPRRHGPLATRRACPAATPRRPHAGCSASCPCSSSSTSASSWASPAGSTPTPRRSTSGARTWSRPSPRCSGPRSRSGGSRPSSWRGA